MAIIHQATLTPSKRDLVAAWLDRQPWAAGAAGTELLGSYRFDDPAGEVGVEAMVVRRGDSLLHVPLTYRGAELPGGEAHLVGTMQHSVLGKRWVYDAAGDPVAVECFVRALRGEQSQAAMEIWDEGRLVERRDPSVRVRREPGVPGAVPDSVTVVDVADARLGLVRVLGVDVGGSDLLLAEWAAGHGVVAALI